MNSNRTKQISDRLAKSTFVTIINRVQEEIENGASKEEVRLALEANIAAALVRFVELYEPDLQLAVSNKIISDLNYHVMTRRPRKGRAK
ncbi:hypothetical protein [Methylosinus sp. Sm6]|uniref:hypothetical protein n=1 Tax=Methylosinus sp. Sm6 TaxID=2866948 RepID=UPI001C990EF4|nr:hypothetical protein [Methylosinus sp. Sm6]MBY6244113.1 hypothetical protein [Methylosinus sp. Sm6]